MFPLPTKTLPADAVELSELLGQSLDRLFAKLSNPVSVRATAYPQIDELRLKLDGAELRPHPPRAPVLHGTPSPAFAVGLLEISGTEIAAGPAALNLNLSATDVRLAQTRSENDEVVLTLQSAADGRVEISAAKTDLEQAIAAFAKAEAGKHGVGIDQVHLKVNPRGERGLDAEVQLRTKKLFLTTTIRLSAQLDLTPDLQATLSEVRCSGDGAMGAMACSFLEPHLQKVNGRSLSLLALPLGEIRLRDVRLAANERLTVSAEFGA
ncbi:MAG: hypothetical protein ACR2HH_11290 [Chthoniobacterales bacterium]